MTVRVETVADLRGLTDRHMELVQACEQSLKQRKPIRLGSQAWVIVGITIHEGRQTIQIRGVRVVDEPAQPQEQLT